MEELVFNCDESEAPKKKEVITYEPVEKGIRRKLKDGKKFSHEATADFGRVEIYDEELKKLGAMRMMVLLALHWQYLDHIRMQMVNMMLIQFHVYYLKVFHNQ